MGKATYGLRLAAVASVGALALAACGGSSDNSSGNSSNSGDKKGGTLTILTNAEQILHLDPQRNYTGEDLAFASGYLDRTLTAYKLSSNEDEAGKLVGDLATDTGKASDGAKTWAFTLRDGATWEDGKPITSKDIKYGIERVWAQDVLSGGPVYLQQMLDPKNTYKGPYKDKAKDHLGLKAISTPDDKTIVFHLPKPNSDFPQVLAMVTASPVRQDMDTKSKYGQHPFSSGPYKFQSYSPGKKLVLVRNSNWKASSDPVRKAYPDTISLTISSNQADMDQRLINGDFDLDAGQTGLGPQGRTIALKQHKANLDNPVSGFIRYAVFPQSVKPFDNLHCRKAVIYAADHVSIQTARGGPIAGGDIGTNMLPPSIAGGEGQKYDPYQIAGANKNGNDNLAKQELKACGQPKGFKTTIAVRNNKQQEVATAESMQAALKKVGITADIYQYDGSQSPGIIGSPSNVAKKKLGIIIMGWGPDFPTVQGYGIPLWASSYILQSGNNNYALIKDKKIDGLFDQYNSTLDNAKKTQISTEINHKVMEGGYYLPFTFERLLNIRSSRLANVYTTNAYSGYYDFVNLGLKSTK